MLRACRSVLKPGGRIAFYTIFVPSGLSEADRQRVVALKDPPEVASRAGQDELLQSAGFIEIEENDETPEFLKTARGWHASRLRHAAALRKIEGEREFDEAQTWRQARLEAIESGLLRRALFVGRRS